MPQQPIEPGNSEPTWARRFVEPTLVIVCTLILMAFLVNVSRFWVMGEEMTHDDAVSFWAAGHQLVHSTNPYDSGSILKLEHSVGYTSDRRVLIMRNPPPALCLVMPLGVLRPHPAAYFWSILLIGALLLSVHLLWIVHGRSGNKLHLLAYAFAPAILCVSSGQTGLFSLIGCVLFLRFHRERPIVAGLSLWLCALKPHLFLPFGLVLLIWAVTTRCYRLLAAAMAALVVSSGIASYLDPSIWVQYAQMLHTQEIDREFIPCLGVALRFALNPHAMWLQYLPAALGCAWAVYFYRKHRETWDWKTDGALVLLVSVLVSPYAWITDQSLVIPALVAGLYRATNRFEIWIPLVVSAVIEFLPMIGKGMHSALYVWTMPVWLAWYLYVSIGSRRVEMHQTGAIPVFAEGGAA